MGEAAAERAAQPDRVVRNVAHDPGEQRPGRTFDHRAVERGMAHARPDRKHAALDREAIETGDRIDVDEMRRPRHAERHHRDEALTAGEDAAVLRTEFSEVRQRVIDRLRRVVDERRRFHRARPFGGRERGFARMLSSHRPPSSTQVSRARNKRQRNEVHVRLTGRSLGDGGDDINASASTRERSVLSAPRGLARPGRAGGRCLSCLAVALA